MEADPRVLLETLDVPRAQHRTDGHGRRGDIGVVDTHGHAASTQFGDPGIVPGGVRGVRGGALRVTEVPGSLEVGMLMDGRIRNRHRLSATASTPLLEDPADGILDGRHASTGQKVARLRFHGTAMPGTALPQPLEHLLIKVSERELSHAHLLRQHS